MKANTVDNIWRWGFWTVLLSVLFSLMFYDFFLMYLPAKHWCQERGYTYVVNRHLVICVDINGHAFIPPNNP